MINNEPRIVIRGGDLLRTNSGDFIDHADIDIALPVAQQVCFNGITCPPSFFRGVTMVMIHFDARVPTMYTHLRVDLRSAAELPNHIASEVESWLRISR